MYYDVVNAACLKDYIVHLEFEDGLQGVIDLKPIVGDGPMFEPLKDIDFFVRLRADPKIGTIVWPNQADLAPDMLYEKIKSAGGDVATYELGE